MDEQKPRRQGRLSNEAPKPKQKRKLPGEEIGGVLGRTRKAWMRKLGPKSPTKLNDTRLKRRSAKKQKSSEEAEAPLESTGVEPGLPENVSEHPEDVPELQPVNSDVSIVRATKTTGQCFRIQNVPPAWSKYILLDFLRRADESLQSLDESDISLCPAFSGPTQTALLYPEETPACLRWPEGQDSMRLRVSNDSERKKVDLEIDSNFYDLTPLYTPTGGEEIVADVVAVTGLAGHAFGSWRHRETHAMWLKDFLPREASCENVRILSYGYNTKLVGKGTVDDTFLDYRRNFIQQLENARNSEEESERPIIFIGHSLGGIVILQALSQAKNRPRFHGHILDSTEAILFFGTPHAGLNGVSELMDMVRDMSGHGTPSSRIKLLSLLTEDSEFLATLRDGLTDIWDPDTLKVFSFYELGKTPTVQKELTAGEWKRFGKAVGMVKKMSALLHLRNEIPIPISRNHTEMVKFSSAADKDYRTVATHIGNCVKDIISREDSDEDDSEECGSDTTDPDERRRKRKRKRRRVISSRNNSESKSDDEDESGSGTEGESSTPSSDSSDSSSESGENSGNIYSQR